MESQAPDIEILTVAVRPRLGGMEAWIDQVAHGLAALGWSVRLAGVTDQWGNYTGAPFEAVHIEMPHTPEDTSGLINKLWRWTGAENAYRRKNLPPPRLRISDCTPGALALSRRLSESQGIRRAVLAGGDVFSECACLPFSSLMQFRTRKDLNGAKRIFVDGPDLVESFTRNRVKPELLQVQYHGVDLNRFDNEAEGPSFFTTEGTFKLAWHGRLTNTGGPLRFVDIAHQVEGAAGRLVGDGIQRTELKDALDKISLPEWRVGSVSDEDLFRFLREADCGVYPLKNMAGIPRVLLDAMAAGLPVVTWDVGASRGLVRDGENGFICRTLEETVETVRRLRDDPELRNRVGTAAHETIERNWTADATVRQLADRLEEILNG